MEIENWVNSLSLVGKGVVVEKEFGGIIERDMNRVINEEKKVRKQIQNISQIATNSWLISV